MAGFICRCGRGLSNNIAPNDIQAFDQRDRNQQMIVETSRQLDDYLGVRQSDQA